MRLRIGTRGSALARAQSADVARGLETLGHSVETVVITTAGDQLTDRTFADVGTFGVFVRELESALLEGRIDIAVHSYKDLPSRSPEALIVAAVPERLDAADVLLTRAGATVTGRWGIPLHEGARVGTSAARRQALLHALRPDLEVGLLRGNVPTRLAALAEGRFDAIVLAAAGVARLERAAKGSQAVVPDGVTRTRLDPCTFVPAPAQGAIAVQVRADAGPVRAAVAALDDPHTARTLRAEREVLRLAEGGCDLPFGAWCRVADDGRLVLVAVRSSFGGAPLARVEQSGEEPVALAGAVWRRLANGVGR